MEDVHLKLPIRCFISVGFWSLRFKNRFLASLYACFRFLTISVFLVFVLTQFIEVYRVMGKSLEEFSSLMAVNFLYTMGLVKVHVAGNPTVKRLVKKIQQTERNIIKGKNEAIAGIFLVHVKKNNRANMLMIFLGLMCYILFCLTPVFIEFTTTELEDRFYLKDNTTKIYRERPLPLISWFPFDPSKYYEISFFWHCFAAWIITTYIVACNNLFFSLMIFAVGQIAILQHDLLKIKARSVEDTNQTLEGESALVERNLRKIVLYHNAIIRFINELDTVMRFFLLMDFAGCALQIAMIGFEIAVTAPSLQLFKNIIYLGSMVTQLFLFYWHGNEVLLESTRVADAIWNSDWHKCEPKARRILLQIMIRAQKPLRLSVGSFYDMSTKTMVILLRSSYSYMTLMRQFYARKGGSE